MPVAAALRARYPDAQIDWLVDAKHAAMLDLVPVIGRRVDGGQPALVARRSGAVRALRRERYDVALDLQGLVKSAVARAAVGRGARRRLRPRATCARRWRAGFYTETCDPGDGRHVIDKNLSVLAPFGIAETRRAVPARRARVGGVRARLSNACGATACAATR